MRVEKMHENRLRTATKLPTYFIYFGFIAPVICAVTNFSIVSMTTNVSIATVTGTVPGNLSSATGRNNNLSISLFDFDLPPNTSTGFLNTRRHHYRSLRFPSLPLFLQAMRSPLPLLAVAPLISPASNHTYRHRTHRNTRQCSPLQCDGGQEGEGGCRFRMEQKQRLVEGADRQCVQVFGKEVGSPRSEQVRVYANESYDLYERFCALRHLYCHPQPEIIAVNQLCKMALHFRYEPPYAVLHRCPQAVPCCGEDTRCVPVPGTIKNVSFSFYVLEISISASQPDVEWNSVETFTFENHTACSCTQTKSQVVETDHDDHLENAPIKKSKLLKKKRHVCTRCPKPYICEKKSKRNICKCQCASDDTICKNVMRGLRPLNKSQQKCVRLQYCFEPKCVKRLSYNKKSGKCTHTKKHEVPSNR